MKKLLVFLMFVSIGFAQNTGQNVISQQVLASTTQGAHTGPITYTSTPVQNIGQSQHTGIINVTVGFGSTNITVTASIQGSIDGTNWQNLGLVITNYVVPVNGQQVKFYGYGSYPYIRTNVLVTIDSQPATFSILYEGNSIPSFTVTDTFANNNNLTTTYNTPGTGMCCALTTGAALTTFIPASTTGSIVIYGMEVYSDNTGTSLVLYCDNNIVSQVYELGSTSSFIFPVSVRPLLSCPFDTNFKYELAGTSTAYMNVHWRYE